MLRAGRGHPAQVVVVHEWGRGPGDHGRAPHPQPEGRGDRPVSRERAADHRPERERDPELLADLPVQGGGRLLPGLHLPAGELPLPGELCRCRPAGGQDPGRGRDVVDDGGGDHQTLVAGGRRVSLHEQDVTAWLRRPVARHDDRVSIEAGWSALVERLRPGPPLAELGLPATTLWVALGAGLLVVAVAPLWRLLRVVVTVVHELGHAVVGILVGRSFTGLVLRPDMSGHAVTVGPSRGMGLVATTWAGYPAPALVGAGL